MNDQASRFDISLTRGGFSLEVDAGWDERVAVLFGRSGSGKSTLLEAALGLATGVSGLIRIAGETLHDTGRGISLAPQRRGLGWVPQDPTLFPHLSVSENLAFGRGRAGNQPAPWVDRAIDALEIGALLDRNVEQLSGGERQRVAIARAIASNPRALLMDEPMAALDIQLRAKVLRYLLRIRDELEIPIIYITHDPDEAMLIGEIVVVLDGGRVVASGPTREVLWSHAVLPLSESLGLENTLIADCIAHSGDGSLVETTGGLRLSIPGIVPVGERLRIGLRAEDVLLSRDPPGRISARNAIVSTVTACDFSGPDARIHLDTGEPIVAKLTTSAARSLEIEVGIEVYAIIKAQALRRLA